MEYTEESMKFIGDIISASHNQTLDATNAVIDGLVRALECANAELDLIRLNVIDAYSVPYVPQPRIIMDRLYPDVHDIEDHIAAAPEGHFAQGYGSARTNNER